jgi:hypothetical protein
MRSLESILWLSLRQVGGSWAYFFVAVSATALNQFPFSPWAAGESRVPACFGNLRAPQRAGAAKSTPRKVVRGRFSGRIQGARLRTPTGIESFLGFQRGSVALAIPSNSAGGPVCIKPPASGLGGLALARHAREMVVSRIGGLHGP